MVSDAETQLRTQLRDAFENADFPVQKQMDLVPALPNGPGTRFEAGDTSFTAMEMAAKLGNHQNFPYHDVDALVDDVVEGLKAEGMV